MDCWPGEDDLVGIGGWAITSCQVVWFAETQNMQDIRAVWPCLVKPGQRYIACFKTLAQLALLQATHSHIGGGYYSFSMPSGTDNSATEASLNKLFTTFWPLQLFVQSILGSRSQCAAAADARSRKVQ